MNPKVRPFTFLLGLAGLGLITTVVVAASQGAPRPSASKAPPAKAAPMAKYAVPPLPSVGFAPVRPMDVVRATYDFAAQHPEVLSYVPCFCGCERSGHQANDDCFVRSRDAEGKVTWEPHGMT